MLKIIICKTHEPPPPHPLTYSPTPAADCVKLKMSKEITKKKKKKNEKKR